MYKYILATIIFFLTFATQMPDGLSSPNGEVFKENEIEIKNVVKGAVEETGWLFVTSRQELENVLKAYYTGPLLKELVESVWCFTRLSTDWDYTTSLESLQIVHASGNKATVQVDILEKEALTGFTCVSRAEYSLVQTEGGWRINGYSLLQDGLNKN